MDGPLAEEDAHRRLGRRSTVMTTRSRVLGGRLIRGPVIVMGVVAIAIVLTAAGRDRQHGATVLVVGDSITAQSQADIRRELLADGWRPIVEGHPGTAIVYTGVKVDWPVRVGQLAAATHPDVTVVELGTNDGATARVLARGIDAVMRRLRHVPQVLWLNTQEPGKDRRVERVNAALRQAQARWPNLQIVDMDSHFAHRRAWHTDPVHLNRAGQRELGRFIRQALDSAAPFGVPPAR